MKKSILLTLITLLSLGINAQSLIPTKFGIKAGLNFSNLSISSVDGVKPTIADRDFVVATLVPPTIEVEEEPAPEEGVDGEAIEGETEEDADSEEDKDSKDSSEDKKAEPAEDKPK